MSTYEPPECDPETFKEAAKMYKDLYVQVIGEACEPCDELKELIKDAEIAIPIVEVHAGACSRIADELEVDVFPTVIKLKRGKVKTRHTGDPKKILKKMVNGK